MCTLYKIKYVCLKKTLCNYQLLKNLWPRLREESCKATVCTKSNTMLRPIYKVYPLEILDISSLPTLSFEKKGIRENKKLNKMCFQKLRSNRKVKRPSRYVD